MGIFLAGNNGHKAFRKQQRAYVSNEAFMTCPYRNPLRVESLSDAVRKAHRERELEEARHRERLTWDGDGVNMCLVLTVPDVLYRPKFPR